MNIISKNVLIVNLSQRFSELKTYTDLGLYIGGVGMAIKLAQQFHDKDPLIFAIGPFNGYFPYASKTAFVINETGVVEDLYIGGTLSLRMRFAGLDAIIFLGTLSEPSVIEIINSEVTFHPANTDLDSLGLPGRRSKLNLQNGKLLNESYFTVPERIAEEKLTNKQLSGLVLTGTEIYKPQNFSAYTELYNKLLKKRDDMTINSGINPSCSNCPLGCVKSKEGEIGGNVLLHSLVACQFSEKIYTDIGIVFAGLNALGLNYTHEDIESLPGLIEKTLKEL